MLEFNSSGTHEANHLVCTEQTVEAKEDSLERAASVETINAVAESISAKTEGACTEYTVRKQAITYDSNGSTLYLSKYAFNETNALSRANHPRVQDERIASARIHSSEGTVAYYLVSYNEAEGFRLQNFVCDDDGNESVVPLSEEDANTLLFRITHSSPHIKR